MKMRVLVIASMGVLTACGNGSWVDVNPVMGCSEEVLGALKASQSIPKYAAQSCKASNQSEYDNDLRCHEGKLQAACR